MSKLIVNTGTLMSGGAERVLSILSTPFADAFDYVEYVLWLDDKYPDIFYEIDSRVKITRISKESGSTNIIKHLWWFRQHVKEEKPDVILAFMVMINFAVMVSQLFCKTPLALAERNDPRHFGKNQMLRKIINWMYTFSNVKKVIMQTENNKNYFSESLRKKIDVIYNPIVMSSEYVGCAIRQEKKKRIVSVARLEPQKHHHILIMAFAEFSKSHPDYSLTLYGEGSRKEELKLLVKELGISEQVLFPGRTNKVYESIKDADMFVMTSKFEGMSNALIEAMCLGLPCISTKVSGATDLIKSGENGILVDVDDTVALVKAMNAIADDVDYAKRLSINSSKTYDVLRSDIVSQRWIEILMKSCNINFNL